MPEAIVRTVQPPLNFIPPNFNPWALRIVRTLLPWWLKSQSGIQHVEVEGSDRLADLYRQFNAGKVRFLLAFRHPCTDDPFSIARLLWQDVPAAARQQGVPLNAPVHSHFIYDRGIPLWAGNLAAWVLPRLGGTSIQRGKLDVPGLRSARDLFANGRFPLAAAPEGATNNHNEIVSPLEPGIAQLGFWCVEDLRAQNRTERVAIVPLGIRYSFLNPPWAALDSVLDGLEQDVGLEPLAVSEDSMALRYRRLYRLGDRLLNLVGDFYRQFYGATLEAVPASGDVNADLAARLHILLESALRIAEAYFGLKPRGRLEDRCRRLEQAGWDRIYRSDRDRLSPIELGLANWVAAESSFRMAHMRLVERFTAVTGRYVREKPTAERFADTVTILWRVSAWIRGADPSRPPRLGDRRVALKVAEPLWLEERYEAYQASRRQATAELTADLQAILEDMVVQ